MRRAEAEKHIGKRVQCTISKWGTYAGTLINIIDDKPFRVRIRVEEILKLPVPYDNTPSSNIIIPYPIEKGKILEVSADKVEPYPHPKRDYMETLRRLIKEQLEKYQKEKEKIMETKQKHEKQGYLRNFSMKDDVAERMSKQFSDYLRYQLKLRERWIEILHIWKEYYFGEEE